MAPILLSWQNFIQFRLAQTNLLTGWALPDEIIHTLPHLWKFQTSIFEHIDSGMNTMMSTHGIVNASKPIRR
jgi:hypothetical protein